MTADVVIRAEGLGKKYLIGHQAERENYVALRDVIARSVRGFARSARDLVSGRAMISGDVVEEFWALRDVDFEVRRGEVMGVIGRNGAGKSTLLKVLSRITEPSAGRVEIRGRVASLLEVGTGFHPELTGRENVYLNGAILGMTHAEIRRKFDEIVAFAEVERFLDTPVKRYSSGMYVRLAFAVAAHLEPEILIVDEVLAVGDAEFQKKCLGKMGEVAGAGRTVLFVSHNIGALTSICETGLLLSAGRVAAVGPIKETARIYGDAASANGTKLSRAMFGGPLKALEIDKVLINGAESSGYSLAQPQAPITVTMVGHAKEALPGLRLSVALSADGVRLLTIHDPAQDLPAGPFEATFTIPALLLRPGEYWLAMGGSRLSGTDWLWGGDVARIEVASAWSDGYEQMNDGLVNIATPGRRTVPAKPPAAT